MLFPLKFLFLSTIVDVFYLKIGLTFIKGSYFSFEVGVIVVF